MSATGLLLSAALVASLILGTIPPGSGANEGLRRSPSSPLHEAHLMAFPRVGRSSIIKTWPLAKILEGLQASHACSEHILQSTYCAQCPELAVSRPKVTRGGLKKDVFSENMWFGPRLGKKSLNPSNPGLGASSYLKDGWKREYGLIPFPRNGRSAGGKGLKKNGVSNGNGLWFGPRLGKRMDELFLPDLYKEQLILKEDSTASPLDLVYSEEDYDMKS